jgi:hypothetical protein
MAHLNQELISKGQALLQTHHYDNQIFDLGANVLKSLSEIEAMGVEQRRLFLVEGINAIGKLTSPSSIVPLLPAALCAIVSIIGCISTPQNQTGIFKADVLLIFCLQSASKHNEYRFLVEQLYDMYTNGFCPQGRVNRLLQLVKAFLDL